MKGYNTRSVWIISAEIRYLLSEQKKFQNKSKNIDEVYQSVFFSLYNVFVVQGHFPL